MKLAFLGDSITFGYGLENKEMKYSTLVCESLGMEEENYGITGTLIARAGLNQSDGKDFLSRSRLIYDADIAVVFGGTNDYFWSDRPIEGEGDGYFACAVERLLEDLKSHREGKLTLFVTPYPHNGIGNYLGASGWKESNRHDTDAVNYNGHRLEDYARVIVKACKEKGLPCLDLFDGFAFDWQKHTLDGCHPNEEGHRLLAEAVAKELSRLLGK